MNKRGVEPVTVTLIIVAIVIGIGVISNNFDVGLSPRDFDRGSNIGGFGEARAPSDIGTTRGECNDGIDNDGDGSIDFGSGLGNDGDCSSKKDKTEDFYEVCTPRDLDNVREDLFGSYIQKCDVDLDDYYLEPIGDSGNSFRGFYDGNGFKIIGMELVSPPTQGVGLFGVSHGDIWNVALEDIIVTSDRDFHHGIGGLVGGNVGTIVNSYTTGFVNGDSHLGGLVGINYQNIHNSYSKVSVLGKHNEHPNTGGLVGMNKGGIIRYSYATGEVLGNSSVGGLVGTNGLFSRIIYSHATGLVDGSEYEIGGLVGTNYGDIDNSYSTGDVIGILLVGGLVGHSEINTSIVNSFAGGTVIGDYNVGGLVGIVEKGSVIEYSYSFAEVNGINDVGGLVGRNDGNIENSQSSSDVNGEVNIGGLVGLNSFGRVFTSLSSGSVNGIREVGGLVGLNFDGVIEESYSTGSVSGDFDIGGLIGESYDGSVGDSYSTGSVSGDSSVGGLVGLWGEGDITESYWDIETSGQDESDAGEGRTTEEMTSVPRPENTYINWDFVNIWNQRNGFYPWLYYETREVLLADLTVDSINWTLGACQGNEGDRCPVRIDAGISEILGIDVEEFEVRFEFQVGEEDTQVEIVIIESLGGGESIIVSGDFTGAVGQNHIVRVIADSDNLILETNEENNEMTIEFVL